MKTYMLDTNICSYIIRRMPETVIHRLHDAEETGANIVISIITYAKLLRGAANPRASKDVRNGIDALVKSMDKVLPLNLPVMQTFSQIYRHLYKAGNPIGFNDALIAAHAISENCVCVTNNTREFARIPGLLLENWAE